MSEDASAQSLLRQLFSIPLEDNRHLVYAPLKRLAFIANGALVNRLYDLTVRTADELKAETVPSELRFLADLDFFTPASLPDDDLPGNQTRYDAVILFLTNQCNLQCTYCYARAGEYESRSMPWEIAQAGIDHVLREMDRNGATHFTLGFHGGGEPTMNWPVLTRAVAYTRQETDRRGWGLSVSGSFNGYWSETVRRTIIDTFTDLSLSFDGLPEIQSRQRPARGNEGSAERVIDTLRALDEAEMPYGIRMTVTRQSVDRLPESIEFICRHFRPRTIQVEPVFPQGRAMDEAIIDRPERFIEAFIDSYDLAAAAEINLFYSGARLEALTRRFCLAPTRALVLTPEGDVTTCFEIYSRRHPHCERFFVGQYQPDAGFVIDEEKLHRHFARTVDRLPYCEACFCKWHCAGDCAAKTFAEDNGGFQSSERCRINCELTKYLLLKRIQESPGSIWLGTSIQSEESHE